MTRFAAPRLGLLAVLLVMLWNPYVPWTRGPVHVIVVLDQSLSAASYFTDEDWSAIMQSVGKLGAESEFTLIRYGSTPVVEVAQYPIAGERLAALATSGPPTDDYNFDRSGTNTELALRAALRLSYPSEAPAILLVTDGNSSEGDADTVLSLAKDADIPVHVFDIRSGKTLHDAWIEDILLPERARLGERIPLAVTVGSTVSQNARLKVLVDQTTVSEIELTLSPRQPTQIEEWVSLPGPGVHEVSCVIESAGDEVPENNGYGKLVNVEPDQPILFVTRNEAGSPLAHSLSEGGWSVQTTHPANFQDRLSQLRNQAAIVLDDIAIDDMTEQAWTSLTNTVRGEGTGLVVLGGSNSFSSGSYRHSALEALLPVTAEASEPQGQIAILFLVDKSGSMDRDERGASRFAYARESVLETARTLASGDLAGLLWFDAVPREALVLAAHEAFDQLVRRAWTTRPSGGTVLAPALRRAVELLGRVEVERRFLVIVTDGFLSPGDELLSLERNIDAAGIDVISLVVGGNQDMEPLSRLSALNDGVLLRVERIATLPQIMRKQVEKRRNPVHLGTVVPQVRTPVPHLAHLGTWPKLSGYMVTKARPRAVVHLQSDAGDPLLAMHHVGATRVVALPGGLGRWAESWPGWRSWGRFAGGLLSWVAARDQNARLDVRILVRPGRLEFVVDAVAPNFDWLSRATAKATIQDDALRTWETPLIETAPGHYTGRVPVSEGGRYKAVVRIGDEIVRRDILNTTIHEFLPPGRTRDTLAALMQQGLLKPWRPGMPLAPESGPRSEVSLRSLLVPFVMPLYLLLIALERAGLPTRSQIARWLEALKQLRRQSSAQA